MTRPTHGELFRQASELLAENKPGKYWGERKKIERRLDNQRTLERLREAAAALSAPKQEPGFVYVIGCAGHPVKIGISTDVQRRLAAIQTGSPHRLRIYFEAEVDDARYVERACHDRLSSQRLQGEWFDCAPLEAVEAVRAVISGLKT